MGVIINREGIAVQRLIFHIDVNSAYLSWEAARRVARGEADIRLIPSAIGGDRDKRTGVILAKSIPAKRFGVKTGEPVAMALRKCPQLFLAPPDFMLYESNSAAFMDIVRSYAPIMEKYSIDECFADFTGTHLVYPDPIALAYKIKDRIRDELGFTVNVGVGSNKLLAKMASDFSKPDKVHTLFAHEVGEKLWPLPVGELFSVGGATAAKLANAQIRTVGELACADPAEVQRLIGVKWGKQLQDYANGRDDSPVLAQPEEAKGYSNSTTLETDVTTSEQAYAILLALTESVTARMRADGVKAFCVAVTIRSNDFRDRSHQRKLAEPTDISIEVYRTAKALFAELWDGRTPLRLLGVALTHITHDEVTQLSLFTDENRERARKLDRAADAINKKFGSDTLVRGTDMLSHVEVGRKHRAQMELKREK